MLLLQPLIFEQPNRAQANKVQNRKKLKVSIATSPWESNLKYDLGSE